MKLTKKLLNAFFVTVKQSETLRPTRLVAASAMIKNNSSHKGKCKSPATFDAFVNEVVIPSKSTNTNIPGVQEHHGH